MPSVDINYRFLTLAVSLGVFLFFAINLSVPSGYSYGSGILFLSSVYFLSRWPSLSLSKEDKTLAYCLLALFLVAALVFLIHGNELRTMDMPTRYLLAIPVLMLLLHVQPRLPYLWAGVAMGGVSAAGIAVWQLYWLGYERVDGLTNGTRFGGISTMLCILCAAGLFWVQANQGKHAWRWRIALLIGLFTAAYASLASETRGGWVAIPFVVILFCFAFLTRQNLKRAAGISAVLAIALAGVFYAKPNNVVEVRFDEAVSEVNSYVENRDAQTSVGGRLEIWRAVLIHVPQKPIFGWSHEDFRASLKRLVAEKKLEQRAIEIPHTHNEYLQVLIFQGVVGLIPLLALYIFAMVFFCKRLGSRNHNVKILAVCGTSLLVTYFVLGLTQIILQRNDSLLFFLITLCTLWACMRGQEKRDG